MFINRPATRRLALTVTTGAGALALLTACGNTNDMATGLINGTSAPAASPSQRSSAPFNNTDVMFAQMMIEHHKQAVDMANLAETRAKNPEVKDLAARIKAAQEPEIATMTGWLSEWGKPAAPSGGEEHSMPGMMTGEDMKKLQAAEGTEFDRMFLEMMTAHHRGAIKMAKMEQARGVNPQTKELVKTIETTQQTEIEEMQKLLDQL
ncbi:uncharacterized protein (DUF305 family) [Streptosporangium album]|uniref:Uncharacterized protein (DUF305 family) n=1 Tax=Streptosporangium album TaxID=47479 RepID=A0A7W7S141_9ACTN|nr:DUF305 domain-containing protein [Streptosporangium album]MBB4941840.1 uncharacterized protein (DUF305 family) [Streptosporangium album]